jgi:hypothetical protein
LLEASNVLFYLQEAVEAMMGFLLFATVSRPALGSTQPIQWVPGALSREVKRSGGEADLSPPYRKGKKDKVVPVL